jgi:quercetin dioxygenase-like cupin family protein
MHSFFPREARAKNAAAQTGPSDELDESSVTRDVGRMILFSQPFPGEPRPTFRRPSAPLGDCQNRGHGAGDVTSDAPVTPVSAGDHKIYAVAGGNHVTIELDRALTGGLLDVIEVFAQPGGGPPPHRHSFGEWFLVREGELTLCEERDGQVVTTAVLGPGDSAWVGSGMVHGTLNLSDAPARFQVVGQPGAMTGYFAQAGVLVASPETPPPVPPAGPSQLREISARWGIEFWTGPVSTSRSG